MRHLIAQTATLAAVALLAAPLGAQSPRTASSAPVVSMLDVDEHQFNADRPVFFRLAVSRDANVAVFHVSPTGRLRVVYPRSAGERQLVRAGDTLSLSVGGYRERWLEQRTGNAGWAGYDGGLDQLPFVFAIASEKRIDLSRFGSTGTWRYQFVVNRAGGGDRVIEEVVSETLKDASEDEYTVDAFDYGFQRRQQLQQAYSALAACGAPLSTLLALQGYSPWIAATGRGLGSSVFLPVLLSSFPAFGYQALGYSPGFAFGYDAGLAGRCGNSAPLVFVTNGVVGTSRNPGGGTKGGKVITLLPGDSTARRKVAGLDGGPKDPAAPLDRAKVAGGKTVFLSGEELAGPAKRAKGNAKWVREEAVERELTPRYPAFDPSVRRGRDASFDEPSFGGSSGKFKDHGASSPEPLSRPAPEPKPVDASAGKKGKKP